MRRSSTSAGWPWSAAVGLRCNASTTPTTSRLVVILPTCLALVLCDRVGRQRGTQKASPVGAFSTFDLRSFPGNTPPFAVWVQVTNAVGLLRLQLDFERALPDRPEFEAIVSVLFTMRFSNSLTIGEYEAVLEHGIHLPAEGLYRVRLRLAEATILTRYIMARQDH